MDDPLKELLGVDHGQALAFFVTGLRDLSDHSVDRDELLYNASVLAHYAQVSTAADAQWPAPANLGFVFDNFVYSSAVADDGQSLEVAGAQCLLMAGFFEDQMRERYNIQWYSTLGAGFFRRAAAQAPSSKKARLLDAVATRFEPWRQRHARLSRELRERPYLLPRKLEEK
jgi:hypothetical protein